MIGWLWLVALGLVVVVLALAGAVPLKVRGNLLPRDFDFDLYKDRELSKRGLFDKTKW